MSINNRTQPGGKSVQLPTHAFSGESEQYSFGQIEGRPSGNKADTGKDKDKYMKNRSYDTRSKDKKACENEEESVSEYQQKCRKYESYIANLQTYIEQLKQQKYQRQKYLVKTLKNEGSLGSSFNQASTATVQSKATAAFDISEYMARTQKQKQQAKQIEQKAKKLREKQKLERKLLKRMKQKNSLLLSQQLQSNSVSESSEIRSSRSAVSEIQSNEYNSETKDVNPDTIGNVKISMVKSRLYDEHVMRTPPVRDSGIGENEYPIMSEEYSNVQVELREEIAVLRAEVLKLKKELGQEKALRENYERHIFETDSRNAETQEQQSKKLEDLQNDLKRQRAVIKKLENLLDQNLKLVRVKDEEIEKLESVGKEARSKLEQKEKECESKNKMISELNQEIDAYSERMGKLNQAFGISNEEEVQAQIDLDFLGQKKQSVKFGEDSNSQPSTPQSRQNRQKNLFDSTQLLESKIRQIQNQLKLAAAQKQSLIETHSSLQSRIMSLSQQNTKISSLHRKFTLENEELQEKLLSKIKLSENLESEKQLLKRQSESIKDQSDKNLKLILKLMEEEKNKEISAKIVQLTQKLSENLELEKKERQELEKKYQIEKEQNKYNEELNQQLTSQIRSQIDLSFQLDQTISKQQTIIDKLQQDIKKDKEGSQKLEERIKEMEAEKEEAEEEIKRLREEIQSLNEYIAGMNSEMVRSRIKEKERELELQRSEEEKEKKQEQEKEKEKQPEIDEKKDENDKDHQLEEYVKQLEQHQAQLLSQMEQKQSTIATLKHQLHNEQKKVSQMQQKIVEVLQETDSISNKIKQLEQQKSALTLLTQQYNSYRQSAEQKNAKLSHELEESLKHSSEWLQKVQSSESENVSNNKEIQMYRKQVELLQKELRDQEQELSILKLERDQLEESNTGVEIEMDLLQNIVNNLNTKLGAAEKKGKQLEAHLQGLKGVVDAKDRDIARMGQKLIELKSAQDALQKKEVEVSQLQQTLLNKETEASQLRQQNESVADAHIHLQIQYDAMVVKIKQLTETIKSKQKELSIFKQSIANNETLLAESQKKIIDLQQKLQNSKQLFIAGIPKQDELIEKSSIESMEKMDKDMSLEKFKREVDEYWDGRVREFNRELFELVGKFVGKLVEDGLVRDHRRYLEAVLHFCEQVAAYAEARYNKLQLYIENMNESVSKTPQPQGTHTPDLSSSPIPLPKTAQKTISKMPKISKSLEMNIDEQPAEHLQIQLQNKDKKSVMLSEDFNDAFSREEEEDDRYDSRYKKAGDSIREGSRSGEKDLASSGTFARSAHSVMEELQAQESYKKDMRNLKLAAKKKKRKIDN